MIDAFDLLTPPFCMVAFLGSMIAQTQSLHNFMLCRSAALRFERRPCHCDGCREYVAELERLGKAPADQADVEVHP